jgi:hypothetical protein
MAIWKFYLDDLEVEEPIGWDAIEFTAIRMDSNGIDQPFSTEVSFYDKGARYIKSIYDQFFINQPIAIKIISDTQVSSQPYEFNGFLNLAIYEEINVCDTDSFSVKVGIIDDEFREKFKARQDVDIDLVINKDLDGNEIDPLTFNNIRLHKQDVYLVAEGGSGGLDDTLVASSIINWNWIDGWSRDQFEDSRFAATPPIVWDKNDFKGQFGSAINYNGTSFTDTNAIFVNNTTSVRTIDVSLSLEWYTEFVVANSTFNDPTGKTMRSELWYFIVEGTNTLVSQIRLKNGQFCTYNQPGNYDNYTGNFTCTLQPFQRLLLLVQWGDQGNFKRYVDYYNPTELEFWTELDAALAFVGGSCITITEIFSGGYASFCDTLTIESFLRRVIYKLTGSNDKLISDAFSEQQNGCYWNNVLTNGIRIRNAETISQLQYGCSPPDPNEESIYQLKTTWKDIFENLDRIFCLGWSFEWVNNEWKIRVEPREYFYQNIINAEFTNVGEVSQAVKADKLINNIILGFDDNWKNIATSGAWAIHTDRNYFVANKAMAENSSAELDIRTDIIGEGYAIEFSRRLIDFTDDSASSDRPNDYNIFIIWTNKNPLTINVVQNSEYAIQSEVGNITFQPGEVSMSSNRILTSNSPLAAIYNVYHTPARIAARWWKVLGMHTYGLTTPILRFQVGQYQTQYSSAIEDSVAPCSQYPSGALVSETTDIQASILRTTEQSYLFRPIEINFKSPQSLCDFLNLADKTPYGKVKLQSGSLVVSGYISNITNQPEDNSGGTTSFTLIASNIPDIEPVGERAYSGAYSNAYL